MISWGKLSAVALATLLAAAYGFAGEDNADEAAGPVNRVDISELLSTAGQPAARSFGSLAAEGFEMVINLAPPQSHGSLPDEGGLVAENGLIYVNIPVDWDAPSQEHFRVFGDILSQNRSRKVLVHCQVGFRASTFTFLYRVVYLKHAPGEALESVHEVWVPNETWREFADAVLAANDVDFSLEVD